MNWHARDYSVAEAAQLAGLSLGHLRVILHRNRGIDTLFSEKRKGRRWFSLKDICVLRVGHLLERFGRTYLFGLADAYGYLEDPPPDDAVLIVTMGRSLPQPRRVIADRDIERLAVDETTLLVPIGKIVKSIQEAARVAIHD